MTQTTSAADAMARSNANLVSYLRHVAVCAPDGSVRDCDGALCFAGGHAYPGTYTNGVIRDEGRGARVAASDVLEQAEHFFRPMRRGFAVWVRDDADADLEAACKTAGMFQRPPVEGNPAIWYEGGPMAVADLPGIDLRRIDDDVTRADYLRVVLGSYGMEGLPRELAERVIFSKASIDDPRVAAFAAYREGEVLGGCQVFVEHGVGGMQWGATLPAGRGLGIGKTLFKLCVNTAIEMGATGLAGQASQMGLPLWQSVGFEVVGYYRRYLAKPPA